MSSDRTLHMPGLGRSVWEQECWALTLAFSLGEEAQVSMILLFLECLPSDCWSSRLCLATATLLRFYTILISPLDQS